MEILDQFSKKEKAVIDLLLEGKSNKQIAFNLGVSIRTVEFHLGNIYAKLGVSSRSEAILLITKSNSDTTNRLKAEDLRESTVESPSGSVDNDVKSKSPRRISMGKKILTITGSVMLVGVLIILLVFFKNNGANKTPEQVSSPETPAITFSATPDQSSSLVAPVMTPSPTPDFSEMDVSQWSSVSPDGKWFARRIFASPKPGSDLGQTYTRLDIGVPNGRLWWIVIDRWQDAGLGSTDPQPVQWSLDGQYFYYTNMPTVEGCKPLPVNGSDLQRVDLTTGEVYELLPSIAYYIALSPDESQLAYIQQRSLDLRIRNLVFGEDRKVNLAPKWNYDAGNIFWAPDGKSLTLTIANQPCIGEYSGSGPYADTTSILVIDTVKLKAATMSGADALRKVTSAWKVADQIEMRDPEGKVWVLDPGTGATSAGYCMQLTEQYQPEPGFQTYCDDDFNFAFDYPLDWTVSQYTQYTRSSDNERTSPRVVLKGQMFAAPEMSNLIRIDTYRLPTASSLLEQVKSYWSYNGREETGNAYLDLTIGGQQAYAILNRYQQDISAVNLFFGHGPYYTVMELKAPNLTALDLNWQIAASIQVPDMLPDSNIIPPELMEDSHLLVD